MLENIAGTGINGIIVPYNKYSKKFHVVLCNVFTIRKLIQYIPYKVNLMVANSILADSDQQYVYSLVRIRKHPFFSLRVFLRIWEASLT